jgi:autophagy-related protein 16
VCVNDIVLCISGSSGGKGNQRRTEELQSKVMKQAEELVEMHKKVGEVTTQLAELTTQLRKKDNDLVKKDERVREATSQRKRLEEELETTKKELASSQQTNQALVDEHQALQLAYNSHEVKLKEVELENDRLRKQLMSYKAKDADRLNDQNEKFRSERERQLKEEIEQATREPSVATATSKHSSDKKARKGSLSVAEGSICPTTPLESMDVHDNEVSALCFDCQGNYMATGGADKVVKVWCWREGLEKLEAKCSLTGSGASIMSVQFDHQSKLVLAACNDHASRIWSIHDQRLKHTLTGHSNKVMSAKFLDESQKVVTGSHDRTLKIWDIHHKTCAKTLFAGSSCNDVVTRGVRGGIISAHFDKRIRFWDLRSATANEIALQGKVTSLDIFPDQHLLLCCSRDDTLRLIDLRQNAITATFTAPGFHVGVDWTRAAFSPDGQYVAAGSSDGTLFVWETFSGKVKTRKEHGKEIVTCAWHPKGQLFASADRNKRVILWRR